MGDKSVTGPAEDRGPLLSALEIDLADEILTLALTHRSYAYENGGLPTNERLEFLGDSVLSIVVTERLYRDHPDLPEGQLAKLRASVVNMHALAGVAEAAVRAGAGCLPVPGARRGADRRPLEGQHPGRRHRGTARCRVPRARPRGLRAS